jgi:hypothetical protein
VLSYLIEQWRQSYSLIHRNVAEAIIGLAEFREVERKRVPGTSIAKRSGWSASCSANTILTLRVMSSPGREGKLGFGGADRADVVVIGWALLRCTWFRIPVREWWNLVRL